MGTIMYTPSFFTDTEWEFLVAAVERLIPDGEAGPGGLEAGVPVFIDRRMEAPCGHGACWYMLAPFLADTPPVVEQQMRYPPRDLYRRGIAGADKAFRKENGYSFARADRAERDSFLFRLAAGRVRVDGPPARAFFRQLLGDIKQGYLAGAPVW